MTSPVYAGNFNTVQQFRAATAFSAGNFLIKTLRSIMKSLRYKYRVKTQGENERTNLQKKHTTYPKNK